MEAYATIGVGTWEAVFQVPFDMHPACSELGAYLVVATGEKLDFKECVAVGHRKFTVSQTRFLQR